MTVSDAEQRPAVFTPNNEPYLGLQSVLWFDRMIVWALESNHRVAAYTHAHTDQLSPLQKAACQVIPQGINIALSIRELVRQGYLFPAMVLMRPLIERAAVLSYLADNPEAVSLWESGWKYSQRPPLARMLQSMSGASVDVTEAGKVCAAHNHIVHADPVGTYYNLVHLGDGRAAYARSKMLDSPELAETISMEAQCYLIVLGGRMAQVFPEANVVAMSPDVSVDETVQQCATAINSESDGLSMSTPFHQSGFPRDRQSAGSRRPTSWITPSRKLAVFAIRCRLREHPPVSRFPPLDAHDH